MSRRPPTGLSVDEVRRFCAALRQLLGERGDAPAAFEARRGRPWDPRRWDQLERARALSDAGAEAHCMIQLFGASRLADELDRLLEEFEDRHQLRPALRPELLADPAARVPRRQQKQKQKQKKETA